MLIAEANDQFKSGGSTKIPSNKPLDFQRKSRMQRCGTNDPGALGLESALRRHGAPEEEGTLLTVQQHPDVG
jgi:hypothetical protein